MKQSAKVFIWIGMVIQFFLIYPIIVGVFALKKIEESTSKEDLKTMGVLVIFFCSLLGGIFMLNIDNRELSNNNTQENISKKEKVTQTIELDKKKKILRGLTQFGIYVLFPLLLICLPFSISLFEMYEGVTYIPLVLNCLLILSFIPVFVIFCVNKQRLSGTNIVFLSIFCIISIALFVMSIVTNYCYAHTTETYQNYYGRTYYYSIYGNAWESWVVFGLSLAMFLISLFVIILNLCTKQTVNLAKSDSKEISSKSGIESELNEAKRLYEMNVITEEEYKSIRVSIINKYYKLNWKKWEIKNLFLSKK